MSTRDAVLNHLKASPDWLSGQAISDDLGCSRAAVAKHMRTLEREGYRIESAPRRGYRLAGVPDRLIASEVQPLLHTDTFGRECYQHADTTGSTNDDARILAAKGCPSGALVVAETQSAGRGRHGREWVSPPGGGIYATLVLRPQLALEHVPLFTLTAAVAAADAVAAVCDLAPTIKWPNDLLVNSRKVVGILTEAVSEVESVDFLLIGIGINVNTPAVQLPERPIYPASSLAIEAGRPLDRKALLAAWVERMEFWNTRLEARAFDELLSAWHAYAGIIGRGVIITQPHGEVHGTVQGTAEDGALLLERDDGTHCRILSGDLRFAPDDA